MKRFRWQLIIIFLTGIIIGALLLIEQPNIRTLVGEPGAGGTYTEGLIGSLQRLNPLLDSYNQVDKEVDRLIFSRLISFDSRGIPIGDLAESWEVSKDGIIYNVFLRDNARWHDGATVTGDDVIFTVDLMRNGGSIIPADIQEFWASIEVSSPSPLLVQFILPGPFAPFLDYLSFGILPEHILGGETIETIVDHPFNLQPIGSGPYQFNRLIVEDGQIVGVVLNSFTDYFSKQAYINEISFRYYPDALSALNALQEGKLQGIGEVETGILQNVSKMDDMALYSSRKPILSIIFLNLNNQNVSYLQDVNVRKALYLAIDRRSIINDLYKGQAISANGVIFPGTWAYFENSPQYEYDLTAAEDLLTESGYTLTGGTDGVRNKDGVGIVFTLLCPDNEEHQQLAQMIQAQWEKLDIQVEIQSVPYDELINDHLTTRDYQAALVDLNFSNTPDPDPYPFWDQANITGGQNYSQWDNRLASEYLENARVTSDLETRTKLYKNFQVVFHKELPALPLFYPVYTFTVNRQVQGISTGPIMDTSDRFATILDWYLVLNAPNQLIETAISTP